MKRYLTLGCLLLSSCATMTASEGMLATITTPKTLDNAILERQCDLEDGAACYFLRGRLPSLSRLPIVQGVAPADRAVFVVQVGPLRELRYFLRQKEDQSIRVLPVAKVYSREGVADRLERIEVTKLEANKTYELLAADRTGQLVDVRGFRPLRDGPEAFRFAFVAGTDDQTPAAEEEALWKSLFDRQPRLLLGLGNLVTTTGEEPLTPAALWARYAETRANLSIFRLPTLVPFAATWNALDFGTPGKQAGRDNPHADDAREIQEAFFPAIGDAQTVNEGPGVAKALRVANQTFVLLDDRSFREGETLPAACRGNHALSTCPTASAANDGVSPAHFGRLQDSWAAGLAASAKGPVWFLSGDPWFGGAYPLSSLEGSHPAEFQRFREDLEESVRKAAKAKGYYPFFFGSANPLFTEARPVKPFPKSAYTSTEFSVAFLHPRGAPPEAKGLPGPGKGGNRAASARYLFFTTWPKGDSLRVSAEAVEAGNRTAFALRTDAKPFLSAPPARAAKKAKRRSR